MILSSIHSLNKSLPSACSTGLPTRSRKESRELTILHKINDSNSLLLFLLAKEGFTVCGHHSQDLIATQFNKTNRTVIQLKIKFTRLRQEVTKIDIAATYLSNNPLGEAATNKRLDFLAKQIDDLAGKPILWRKQENDRVPFVRFSY